MLDCGRDRGGKRRKYIRKFKGEPIQEGHRLMERIANKELKQLAGER